MTGAVRIPSLKPQWAHKTGRVVCPLYALCAGAAAHRHYNCKVSQSLVNHSSLQGCLL